MIAIQQNKEEIITGAFHMPTEERRRQRINDILYIFDLAPRGGGGGAAAGGAGGAPRQDAVGGAGPGPGPQQGQAPPPQGPPAPPEHCAIA